jgi:hypothetical protein
MVACGDDLGLDDWTALPDTVTIFSLSRPDLLDQPSAYDFVNHSVLRVESPTAAGRWDLAVRHENGALALVTAAGFPGQNSRAAIAPITNTSFDELAEAPADTTRYTAGPVAVQPGQVFAVRTRRADCSISLSVRFAKMQVLEVDAAAGSVKFVAITNPFCNDRELIPPAEN